MLTKVSPCLLGLNTAPAISLFLFSLPTDRDVFLFKYLTIVRYNKGVERGYREKKRGEQRWWNYAISK
jgi:hypothetical protein